MNISNKFALNLIIPSLLTLILFVLTIFIFIIPYYRESLLERKRETITELTNTAWSIMDGLNKQAKSNKITIKQAQYEAIKIIENLRYGNELKDYFWITDMKPIMIVHPYRHELDSADLNNYIDKKGKKLFVECARLVAEKNEGFVNYVWQWKDDSTRIVPKLSYVKGFKPWGWIIGTGIYINDVEEQISKLSNQILSISGIILLIIGTGIFYLVRLNLITEKKRANTDKKLQESMLKYKTLVESSTEGIIMLIEGKIVYSNKYLQNLISYKEQDIYKFELSYFIKNEEIIKNLISNNNQKRNKLFENKTLNIESILHDYHNNEIDVILSISQIKINGKDGLIIGIKDVSKHKITEYELNKSIKRFKAITNNIDIGIFRTTIGKNGQFIEINKKTREILKINKNKDIKDINLLDLFYDENEKKNTINQLFKNKTIKDKNIKIKCLNKEIITAQVSLFIIKEDNGNAIFCDGIIQDKTEHYKLEKEKETMLEELQSASLFLTQAVKTILKPVPKCNLNVPADKVAKLMNKYESDSILITKEDGVPIGIITNVDFRNRIAASSKDFSISAHEIMSAPLQSIDEDTLILDALFQMQEKKLSHLCVKNSEQKIHNVINIKDLAQARHQTPNLLIQRIQQAEIITELKESFDLIPTLIKIFVQSGAKIKTITQFINRFSEEIYINVIKQAINRLGSPPTRFSYIVLGSVGRKEQTLVTDQDNAIIYEITEKHIEKESQIKHYYLSLGTLISDELHKIGYNYCKGDIMAKNPKWVKNTKEWNKLFKEWINNSTPNDLMEFSIFFDFRCMYGTPKLTVNLQNYINDLILYKDVFFYHLAQNALSIKPPINFFGNFVVESTKENKSYFDIKKVLMPIVGITRLYCLKNNIFEQNTLKRLDKLYEKSIFTYETYNEIKQHYEFLMMLRLKNQLNAINNNKVPNNYINPKDLTDFERTILKKIFSQISNFQSAVNAEFKGTY